MSFYPKNWTGLVRRGVRILGRVRGTPSDWWCECLVCHHFVRLEAKVFSEKKSYGCGCHVKDHAKHKLKKGQRFDRIVTVALVSPVGQPQVWLCRCDCGKLKNASANLLVRKRIRSCGCGSRNSFDVYRRRCRHCDKRFVTNHAVKVYCSNQCCRRFDRYVGPAEKNCKFCGKAFIAVQSTKQIFCGLRCSQASTVRRRRERLALQQLVQLSQLLQDESHGQQ